MNLFGKILGIPKLKKNAAPENLLYPAMHQFEVQGGIQLVKTFKSFIKDNFYWTGGLFESVHANNGGYGFTEWEELTLDQKKAMWLEFGTDPFFPNIDNITPWADAHGVDPWAWAVSLADPETGGLQPRPFMDEATRHAIPGLQGLVAEMAARIERQAGG